MTAAVVIPREPDGKTDPQAWTRWFGALTPEQEEAVLLSWPCDMRYREPFDFAECHTHDTTFPLGDVCPYEKQRQAVTG